MQSPALKRAVGIALGNNAASNCQKKSKNTLNGQEQHVALVLGFTPLNPPAHNKDVLLASNSNVWQPSEEGVTFFSNKDIDSYNADEDL